MPIVQRGPPRCNCVVAAALRSSQRQGVLQRRICSGNCVCVLWVCKCLRSSLLLSWMFEHACLDTCCFGCLICMCFIFCTCTCSAQLSMFDYYHYCYYYYYYYHYYCYGTALTSKLQIKLGISQSHSMMTPEQPVLGLILSRKAEWPLGLPPRWTSG